MFDFLKKFKKNNSLTDPFFGIFQNYCKTLKVLFNKNGLAFNKAAKLEVALFLLFRLDFCFQKSPDQAYRQLFFEQCIKRVEKNISNQLLDLCYRRLEIYGEIYNDVENKKNGVFSSEFLNFSYDWLISAIKLCKDEYGLMAKERFIPLSLDAFSNYLIKVALQELDIHYTKQFLDYINSINESVKLAAGEENDNFRN